MTDAHAEQVDDAVDPRWVIGLPIRSIAAPQKP